MDRFEDTPGLFGSGAGIGTSANVSCDWCGAKYEGREREDGEPLEDNVSIGLANFGGLEICDCCFEKVEDAVLARMGDIIPWFARSLKAKRASLERFEGMVSEALRAAQGG